MSIPGDADPVWCIAALEQGATPPQQGPRSSWPPEVAALLAVRPDASARWILTQLRTRHPGFTLSERGARWLLQQLRVTSTGVRGGNGTGRTA